MYVKFYQFAGFGFCSCDQIYLMFYDYNAKKSFFCILLYELIQPNYDKHKLRIINCYSFSYFVDRCFDYALFFFKTE